MEKKKERQTGQAVQKGKNQPIPSFPPQRKGEEKGGFSKSRKEKKGRGRTVGSGRDSTSYLRPENRERREGEIVFERGSPKENPLLSQVKGENLPLFSIRGEKIRFGGGGDDLYPDLKKKERGGFFFLL